jgi:hypothetical protein
MLADKGLSLEGKRCLITGSENVCRSYAWFLALLIALSVSLLIDCSLLSRKTSRIWCNSFNFF